ncbi:hypothetical protein FE374_10195 [Georgenia yuyongxinii]|uniref:Pyruvate, water dikinase n=1 Tax=Georgenia yuyongxinii TaxID=2589797 RepID=A0A5B8C2N1_9MICO|nr:PEP/pyruvate-binding domain-containing protein [Georgenia yuyongxinii]QDC24929.1 hypothetical protein FE374_10195 [Georgenia yuyongxinii]
MDAVGTVTRLAEAAGLDRSATGSKAGVLAELSHAGFPVPPGFIVAAPADGILPSELRAAVDAAARAVPGPYAVRSSAVAEDLPGASYAGMYESYLNVDRDGLHEAIRRCMDSSRAARVGAYQAVRGQRTGGHADRGDGGSPGMVVLVQQMVNAAAAGVAFTANPLTGNRDETVVTAVRGLGERLVSGEMTGDEWVIRGGAVEMTRAGPDHKVLDRDRAAAVAELAGHVARHFGAPQDIEWAIDRDGVLFLVQARPMTALPGPVVWEAPGPGYWMRNLRLGEWLPEAMTPLFASWPLDRIEAGYLDGERATVGTVVPFRYAVVNGWYYNALPVPTPWLLGRVIVQSRGRAPWLLFNALVRVSTNPVGADRALLAGLEQEWRAGTLPAYRRLVEAGEREVATAGPRRLVEIVDQVSRMAGEYLWYLAIVGGSAWKMEGHLAALGRTSGLIPGVIDSVQALLTGLPGTEPALPGHAVQSVDWFLPTAGELGTGAPTGVDARHTKHAATRVAAERAVVAALRDRPRRLHRFGRLLRTVQRYTVAREEQARDLTLGWPLLRRCGHALGDHLTRQGVIGDREQAFFLTREELTAALNGDATSRARVAAARRALWERQRRLVAPLTLGAPPRLVGDPLARAADAARTREAVPAGAIVGQPASAGRATGPVRIVTSPEDFTRFAAGDILVAKATSPAWTPLFARAAAVVTDGGTLAAHASLVAREYGIPAVVGTTDATARLRDGQVVTVDGGAGTIEIRSLRD